MAKRGQEIYHKMAIYTQVEGKPAVTRALKRGLSWGKKRRSEGLENQSASSSQKGALGTQRRGTRMSRRWENRISKKKKREKKEGEQCSKRASRHSEKT